MSCVITGVGCISSLGRSESDIVEGLKAEATHIQPYKSEDPRTKATSTASFLGDTAELSPEVPRSYRTDHLNLSYAVVKDALADAGLSLEDVTSTRVALCSGKGASDMDAMRAVIGKDFPRVKPFDFMKILPTAVAGPLSTVLKMKGATHTVQHACATGLRVVTQGMDLIALGRADVVICVSSEVQIPEGVRGFDATRALYRGEDLRYASVPFAKERGGFTHGEGGGCVILESEEHFKARGGKKVYGKPIAYADYSDGEDMVNPSGVGAYNSMVQVLSEMYNAGYQPDFVSAHATSTPNGDIVEANTIYETVADEVPVVAFKRLVGHTITASGIIELIFSLYQMKYGFVISNGEIDPDPEMKPINLPKEQLHGEIGSFVKNAFGFGGLNSVLGVVKYEV